MPMFEHEYLLVHAMAGEGEDLVGVEAVGWRRARAVVTLTGTAVRLF